MRFCRRMSPVSSPSSICMLGTPVSEKPRAMAHCAGAAPRNSGSSGACTLREPCRGTASASAGMMRPYAATTARSGCTEASSAASRPCLSFSGCSTGMPCSSAHFFDAGARRSACRPTGLSGWATTATSRSAPPSRMGSVNSGVPRKTIRLARPPAAGWPGALGFVRVGGRKKLSLPLIDATLGPQGLARIAVVDVGIAGNGSAGAPALIKVVALGGTGAPDSTGGDETIVVAASTLSPVVWFIDPHSDAVVKTLTLTSARTSSFSGGGGYVTGIAVDSGNRRAVLAVWNGFAIVDLDRREIARTILSAPSENFGYDSVAQRIVAPFYACPPTLDICGQYKTPSGATI